MTAAVLFVPKILGAILTIRDRALRSAFGGARKIIGGLLIEQLLSMLLAPTMMLFHSNSSYAPCSAAASAGMRRPAVTAASAGARRCSGTSGTWRSACSGVA